MSTPPFEFHVGDVVVLTGVNRRAPKTVRVEKVGRTRVFIEGDHVPYSKEDGRRLDRYEHDGISPVPVHEFLVKAREARVYLRDLGLDANWRSRTYDGFASADEFFVFAADALRAALLARGASS